MEDSKHGKIYKLLNFIRNKNTDTCKLSHFFSIKIGGVSLDQFLAAVLQHCFTAEFLPSSGAFVPILSEMCCTIFPHNDLMFSRLCFSSFYLCTLWSKQTFTLTVASRSVPCTIIQIYFTVLPSSTVGVLQKASQQGLLSQVP